jgi:DNA excision repair protein ERCC-3
MFYSSKRQAFLVDQGYAFKVITHLQGIETLPNLSFSTPAERRELLQNVMIQNEGAFEIEKISDDLFSATGTGGQLQKKKPGARRTAGTLASLSGGQDMAYVEVNRSKNAELKRAQKKGPSNPFFKKLAREAERRKNAM